MPVTAKERFRQFLKSQALKMTNDREAIVEAVFSIENHFEAEYLAYRVRERGVSKATVYRTLHLLVESGLLRQVIFGDKHGHYEHVHQEEEGHDHLICLRCGGIIEFQHPSVAEIKAAVKDRYGFLPERVLLEISGVCARCHQAGEGGA
ncbi:MAG: Fur family transcriptional regulator [Pseudomonadota bacterium]